MRSRIEFTLNGEERALTCDPDRSVLEVLREDLGLTGTKYGCGEGQCRACTVLVDGEARTACLLPMSFVRGKRVLTIEGLARGAELHPIQQAFLDAEAMQCGYCIPGMILGAHALLERNPRPTRAEIATGLNGNVCRCGGYDRILQAVERAAARRAEEGR